MTSLKLSFGFHKSEQQLKVPAFLAKYEPLKETEDELRARMVPQRSTFMQVNKKYVEEYTSYRTRAPLTFAVQFTLANNGAANVQDVEIIVTLPDYVSCSPTKPIEPKPVYSIASTMKVPSLPRYLTKSSGSQLQFKVHNAEPGMKLNVDPLYMTFASADDAQSFDTDYAINCGADSNVIVGKLKFVFEKNVLSSLKPVESRV
jgi:hypothetical protein